MNNHKLNDPRKYCRNCNHAEFRHNKDLTFPYCGFVPLHLDTYYDVCSCFAFIPSDNLEFLEYVTNKKEQEI